MQLCDFMQKYINQKYKKQWQSIQRVHLGVRRQTDIPDDELLVRQQVRASNMIRVKIMEPYRDAGCSSL